MPDHSSVREDGLALLHQLVRDGHEAGGLTIRERDLDRFGNLGDGRDRRAADQRRLAGCVIGDAGAAESWSDEDAGSERADDAADAMHPKYVERVIVAEGILHGRAEEEADRSSDQTQDDAAHRTAEARCWRDSDETRDCA